MMEIGGDCMLEKDRRTTIEAFETVLTGRKTTLGDGRGWAILNDKCDRGAMQRCRFKKKALCGEVRLEVSCNCSRDAGTREQIISYR